MDSLPDSHISPCSKDDIILFISDLSLKIKHMYLQNNWKHICSFNVDSDSFRNNTYVKSNYSTFSILSILIFQIPNNKKGISVVKISCRDGDLINPEKYKNIFKTKLEVNLFYKKPKIMNPDICLQIPKYWNYLGGYSMDITREYFCPKISIGFNVDSIDKIKFNKLLEYFERYESILEEGPIKKMRLLCFNPDRYEWAGIEPKFWNQIGYQVQNYITEGYGYLSDLSKDKYLNDYLRKSSNIVINY